MTQPYIRKAVGWLEPSEPGQWLGETCYSYNDPVPLAGQGAKHGITNSPGHCSGSWPQAR